MLGQMFYSGQCPPAWWVDAAEPKKPENPAEAEMAMFEEKKASQLAREAKRKAQADTSGLAVVLLTALVERQWVEEDVLARDLNLPPKMVRKAMRYFEQEQLLQREHKKEGKRARKRERELMVQAGLRPAPGQDGLGAGDAEEEDEGIVVGRIISYCALDFPRILDSVRWRLAMMKKNWQKQMRGGAMLQQYRCPNPACGKAFNSLDVFNLMPTPGSGSRQLSCDICGSEIEMVIDDGGQTTGSMEDRKERIKRARQMLEQFDEAMQPLTSQLAACEGLTPPDFMSYNGWVHNEIAIRQRVQTALLWMLKAGPPASKPLPPWLMSAYKQQQQQQPGHPQDQPEQQQEAAADGKAGVGKVEQGLGLKAEPYSLGLKEEVKPEFKQDPEAAEQDDWEAVPLGSGGNDGAAAAAAAAVNDGDAAGDDAEDEDWEDV
ncbi:hypothetical protein COO60DRAFT_1623957 [Scenedesmus sp. NREL 46B-D3]|nr:hypothetical protein COO60DRAFT_1623957 [Scenedesmus sp. NREL 46B-D3]